MATSPSLLLAGAAPETAGELRAALHDLAQLGECLLDRESALRAYQDLGPSAVLVWVGDAALEPALDSAGALAGAGARVGIIARDKDPELILRSMRAGVREFALAGDAADERRAARALIAAASGGMLGSVVTVFPVKGGVGATALATNLAAAVRKRDKRVCLLDVDRLFGDVLAFLDVQPKYSIGDVIANMPRLDRDLLDAQVSQHGSGVAVIAHSEKIEEVERVHAADLESLLGFLRQHYDFVVVDGVRGLDESALAVLDASDRILVVLTPDVPAVRNTQRALELLRGVGHGDAKLRLVLNRWQRGAKIGPELVAETVGMQVAATVSADFAAFIGCINRGGLIVDEAPGSRLAREMAALAVLVAGEPPRPKRRGLFGWWSSGRVAHGAQ